MATENEKIIRALYLKGIMVGKRATIELQAPITGRNEAGESYHAAEKGAKVEALMAKDAWVVVLDGVTHNIPLANGKVR
jgi:hypothetical protein